MSVSYSIITVCFNDKTGLQRTATSIRQQTIRDFEWIVIDGGSDDGSVDVVRDHLLVTHLISEPADGVYQAMNKGVSQVAIMLHDEAQIADLQVELHRQFPNLEILRWDELYPALCNNIESKITTDPAGHLSITL